MLAIYKWPNSPFSFITKPSTKSHYTHTTPLSFSWLIVWSKVDMNIKLKSSLSLFLALLLLECVFCHSFHKHEGEDMITTSTFQVKNSKARRSIYSKYNHQPKKAMDQSLRAKPPSLPNPTQNWRLSSLSRLIRLRPPSKLARIIYNVVVHK